MSATWNYPIDFATYAEGARHDQRNDLLAMDTVVSLTMIVASFAIGLPVLNEIDNNCGSHVDFRLISSR